MDEDHRRCVANELLGADPVDIRHAPVLDFVLAYEHGQQRRATEGGQQRRDRMNAGRGHEEVQRDALQQRQSEQRQRGDLHR